MATTLNPPIASVDAAGDVVSLDFSGTCDQCSDLRIEVSDPNSGDILCTGPVVFNGSNWSKTFSAPGDFEALDFACDKDVQVTLKCRDTTPSQTLLTQGVTVNCTGCSLTIDDAEGTEASAGLHQLVINGTASCAKVNVDVSLNGAPDLHQSSVPVNASHWQATFIEGSPEVGTKLKAYHCNDVISVKVTCEDDKDCFAQTTLPVACKPTDGRCPDTASVLITGPNNFSKTNPTDTELECLPAGNYTIKCTNVATVYDWRSNDVLVTGADSAAHVVSVSGDTMVISLSAGDNRHFSVTAHISEGCAPLRTIAFHCGGKVDCVVSEFSNWGPCINGTQTRTRTVITPPSNGGRPCPSLVQTRPCPPDAVDCVVSNWSAWSRCVNGQRRRTRTIVTPPSNGGRECPALTQTEACTDIVVDLCLLWMFINLGLVLVTAVLIFLAFCSMEAATLAAIAALVSGGTLAAVVATLSAVVVNLLIAAAIFAVITLVSFILWIVLCLFMSLRDRLCDLVDFILTVLHVLIILSLAIAVVLAAIANWGCAAGAVVDVGWLGIVEQIFFWIGIANGCINPFAIFNARARAG